MGLSVYYYAVRMYLFSYAIKFHMRIQITSETNRSSSQNAYVHQLYVSHLAFGAF